MINKEMPAELFSEYLQRIDQVLSSLDKDLLIKEIPDFVGKDFNPSKLDCGNTISLKKKEKR